ncbi:MAG: hypothetical protein HZB56_04490 [Deltaproteobacteria bacterium]|nr:hypothetical protein [Deltaproteobacteria bacterium]
MPDASPPLQRRRPLLWAAALLALALAAGAASDRRGRGSRRLHVPGSGVGRVAMVSDAGAAYRVWREEGLHGRHLLVLTGQWSKPRNLRLQPPGPADEGLRRLGGDLELTDAGSALFTAGRAGLARKLDVVMPPPAFSQRLGEARGQKELERGDGSFTLAYLGLERRFSSPRGFTAPAETVLVLVEPTWFAPGMPADPLGWLAGKGVRWDLALFALDDPSAQGEERQAALAAAQAAGARFREVAP